MVVVGAHPSIGSWCAQKAITFIDQMEAELEPVTVEVSVEELQVLHTASKELLTKLTPKLSDKECTYIKYALCTQDIPGMKVLIKDHKPMRDGKYKLRLFIPSTNFSSCFS